MVYWGQVGLHRCLLEVSHKTGRASQPTKLSERIGTG